MWIYAKLLSPKINLIKVISLFARKKVKLQLKKLDGVKSR